MFKGDASEIRQLADDLTRVGKKTDPAARAGLIEGGELVAAAWRNDAARLHDSHAKHYPDSIDSEAVFSLGSIAVDIGPNADKKQGFLGRILENGGERSPAYLTGLNALTRSEAAVERAIANKMDPLFP